MKRLKLFHVCLALLILIGTLPTLQASAAGVSSLNDMDALFLPKQITVEGGGTMNYRLYIPADYDPQTAYPVVLFLHGAGERGSDNLKQLKAGIIEPFRYADSPIYDCIVIAPQCPEGKKWVNTTAWGSVYSTEVIPESDELKAVLMILSTVQQEYHTDSNRLYVTGLSMGGFGTWDLLVRHPELFAAALPLCGGCDPSKAERLLSIPIWTFHGLLDEKVLPDGTQQMAQAMQSLEAEQFIFTPLPEMDHYIWSSVYARREVFYWLTSQVRGTEEESSTETEDATESDSESAFESVSESVSESISESISETESEVERVTASESESLPQEPNQKNGSTPKDFLLAAGIVAFISAGAVVTLKLFRRKRT